MIIKSRYQKVSYIFIIEFEFNPLNILSEKLRQETIDNLIISKIKSFIDSEYNEVKNKLNSAFQNKDISQIKDQLNEIKKYSK